MTSGRDDAVANDSAPRPASGRWVAAFVAWVAVIWGSSLVQGPQSSLESGVVVELLRPLFAAVDVTGADLMALVVRKCAHLLEYAVLGVIACGLFRHLARERGARPWPRALAVALVPVADECLQLFVLGRSGRPTDVLVDLAGLACDAPIAHAWRRGRRSAVS